MSETTTVATEEVKRITLDSIRLKEYPHFVKVVENKILNQIDPEIKQKITRVIGITNAGIDILLAYGIARALNDERSNNYQTEDFLHCQAVYYKFIDSMWVKYIQIIEGFKSPREDDFVLFVHCCFDKMSSSELARLAKIDKKFKKEREKEFSFSEYLEKEDYRNQLFRISQLKINHSIVLPVPKKEYVDFILSK